MNDAEKLPIEGRAIRFAPSRNKKIPDASFWKIWSQGSEVYASVRTPGGLSKISVHASGQIHYRMETKLKQELSPLMKLEPGPWSHAFELRFLLSDDSLSPFSAVKSLKNKEAYLLTVPPGRILYANLIIGSDTTPLNHALPEQLLPDGQLLWRNRLRDGRPVVLVVRILELDSQNREFIRYVREELKITATLKSRVRGRKYMELINPNWSPGGGNVVLVLPMWEKAFRSEGEVPFGALQTSTSRCFRYTNPNAVVELLAPDGQCVAIIERTSVDIELELIPGQPKTHKLGILSMEIEPSRLIAGSSFTMTPKQFACTLSLDDASSRSWKYTIFARFDGFTLEAELRQTSTSLPTAAQGRMLDASEEVAITIPESTLKLSANLDSPITFAEIQGKFLWRNRL